jgi:hypothetical protein
MPRHIAPPDYEPQAHVRKVQAISFKGRDVRASQAFAGKTVHHVSVHPSTLYPVYTA